MRRQGALLWAGIACGAAAIALCGVLAWHVLFHTNVGGHDDAVTRLLQSYTSQITKCSRAGMPRSICIGSATEACMSDPFWKGGLDEASSACADLPLRRNQ